MVRSLPRLLDSLHGRYALATITANLAVTLAGHVIDWQAEIFDPEGLIDVSGGSPDEFVIPSDWSEVELMALAFVTGQSVSTFYTTEWLKNGLSTYDPRAIAREADAQLSTGGQVAAFVHSAPLSVVGGDIFTVRLGGNGTALLRGSVNSPTWAAVRRLD